MNVQVKGLKELIAKLGQAPREIPVALSRALNVTARETREAEKREIATVFDRPTQYTLNSVMVDPATEKNLAAKVQIKWTSRLGDRHHLMAQIKGGGRTLKRYEKLLQTYGYLPAGMYTVPAKGARIDGYGNMSAGQIVQILSYLRAFPKQGYLANRTARSLQRNKKPREYFIMYDGMGKAEGIYQRLGGDKFPMPVLLFVQQPQYTARYDFNAVAEKQTYQSLKKNIRLAIREEAALMRK